MERWLEKIRSAKKTAIIQDDKKKIHFLLDDGRELVEEYLLSSFLLVRRAWRQKSELKSDTDWEVEIGDPDPKSFSLDYVGIKENQNQPFVTRSISKLYLEWRIRNLPYPIETYIVTADPEKNCITIRTTNKKYFKCLPIPDLERASLQAEQERIETSHKFNTLIIMYKKPQKLIDMENAILNEVKKLPAKKDGEMPQCNPS